MTTVPEELPGRAGLLAALGGGFTAASLLLPTPLRAPLTAILAPLGRTALGAGILAAQAVLSPLWLRRFRSGPGRCGPRPDDATIAGRETGGGRSLMGWLRDRLARLGAPQVTRRLIAEIGQQLSVSPSTVSLLAKLGSRDRVQAVVYADEHGVVTPGEDATGPGADGEEGRR